MTPRVFTRRSICALVAIGTILASCSSDSDSGDTTEPSTEAPDSTDAPVTSDSVAGETEELTGPGLDLGVLQPSNGLVSTLFQGQLRGIDFAAEDIADGGGVLDGPLNTTTYQAPLDGTDADSVVAATDDGAAVMIGPASSDEAAGVTEQLAELEAISCTASATVPGLTADQDQFGLFRTVAPDDVLTTYLANEIAARRDADDPGAAWKVAIVARADDYGLAVGNGLAASLTLRGFDPDVIDYNPRRVNFVGLGSEVTDVDPDLTVLVTYEEGTSVVTELVRSGIDPATMIGLDAFFQPRVATLSGPDGDAEAVNGFNVLGTPGDFAFLTRLFDDDPNGQVSYAAQAYDCAVTLSLATEAVDDGSSATISAAVIDVTGGGTPCTTYADCLDKLSAGENIDYDGVSGQLAIDENGDPTFARFTTAKLEDGEFADVTATDVDLDQLRRESEAFAAAVFNTRLQQALTFLGFYDGPIDGLPSPELTAALAAFQTSVGLPPTGVFDAATYDALVIALGEYAYLVTETTRDIQILLTDLGFYDGPIDGIWTQEVTDSVKALQRELGVPETGVIDAATVQAIYDRGVESGSTTTTAAPTTAAPTSAPPVTVAPTTPPVTVAPTTPPVTAPPTTPPVTAPPTVPPTTPPTTPPPTVPPTTEAPPTTEPIEPPDPDLPNIFDTLQADPNFSTFVDLVIASGFDSDIERIGQFTVFAPTNAAFDALTEDQMDELTEDPEALEALLLNVVVDGRFEVADLEPGDLATVGGFPLQIEGAGASLTVSGATISDPDIEAFNGVIQGLAELPTLS